MDENIFDKLREMSGKFPEKFNILEEQIDVKVQMEYFKFSKKHKKNIDKKSQIDLDNIPNINNEELDIEEKKKTLVELAYIDDPKAFRFIEEYIKTAPKELKDWVLLAMQQSKMLLESSLLNENQIFISTGLGGKGNMLRYFIVLIGEGITEFAEFQQKMVSSEFEFALKNNNCQLEKIEFEEKYVTMTALIPFDVAFQKVFRTTLAECNQYGNFIKPNFLVTNVKTLNITEIKDFIENNKSPNKEEFEDIDFDPIDDDEK
ncbi:MAG: hypothetical protein PF517_08735 [Salinivirgaceae bacterium]|nr:hypothetical protein [Salinivirgaceae bacterium]